MDIVNVSLTISSEVLAKLLGISIEQVRERKRLLLLVQKNKK